MPCRTAFRSCWLLVVCVLLVSADLRAQGMVAEAGALTKPVSGGQQLQTIAHELGVVPKAIIVWSQGNSTLAAGTFSFVSVGFSDGIADQSTVSTFADGTSSSLTRRMQSGALMSALEPFNGTVVARVGLEGWTDTTFTLRWSLVDSSPYSLHYLLIGGTDVSAKMLSWSGVARTGLQSVTNLGFRPDGLLHLYSGTSDVSLGQVAWRAHGGLGVMDATGAQWSTLWISEDEHDPTTAYRFLTTDACINQGPTSSQFLQFSSMDPTGFTLDHVENNAAQTLYGSLALKGVTFKAGAFVKSTAGAPVTQSITGLGFQPTALLMATVSRPPSTSVVTGGRFALGASDGIHSSVSGHTDQHGATIANNRTFDFTDRLAIKVDNDVGTVEASGKLLSRDPDGFTLRWDTNDDRAAQYAYVALAPIAGSASQLVFATPSRTFEARKCGGAANAITIALRDAFGNPAPAPTGGAPFTLSSSSPGPVSWYSDADCTAVVSGGNSLIPAGSSSVSVYYRDSAAGAPVIRLTTSSRLQLASGQTQEVLPSPPSAVTTLPAAVDATARRVTLRGTANPNDSAATGWFRYADADPGSCNDTFGTSTLAAGGSLLGAGDASTDFSVEVESLLPGATYWYCAFASNADGVTHGELQSFQFPLSPSPASLAAHAAFSNFELLEGDGAPLTTFEGTVTAVVTLRNQREQPVPKGNSDVLSLKADEPLKVHDWVYDSAKGAYLAKVSLPACPVQSELTLTAWLNGEAIGQPLHVNALCRESPVKVALSVDLQGKSEVTVGSRVGLVLEVKDGRPERTPLRLVVETGGFALGTSSWKEGDLAAPTLSAERYLLPELPFDEARRLTFEAWVRPSAAQRAVARVWLESADDVARSERREAALEVFPFRVGLGCGTAGAGMDLTWSLLPLLLVTLRSRRAALRGPSASRH